MKLGRLNENPLPQPRRPKRTMNPPTPSGPKARNITAWAEGPGYPHQDAQGLKGRPKDCGPISHFNLPPPAPATLQFTICHERNSPNKETFTPPSIAGPFGPKRARRSRSRHPAAFQGYIVPEAHKPLNTVREL